MPAPDLFLNGRSFFALNLTKLIFQESGRIRLNDKDRLRQTRPDS